MCIGARSVSFYFSKGITIFLKTMYTLLQFSLLVFTICTKILFFAVFICCCGTGAWSFWLVALLYASVCQKGVAMWGAVAVWESNHVWCSICVQRCSGLCPTRLFVILSALCTFACIALNISALRRVDKSALCVHYCLHAARIMIVVCTVCTM